MDLSSLSSNLPPRRPPPSEDPVNLAFKEAALSLTTLYKASQGARAEGYKDTVDDIYNLFCEPTQASHGRSAEETLAKLKTWLEERRRRSTEETRTAQADVSFAQQEQHQETAAFFETEPVLPTLDAATTLAAPSAAQQARFTVHATQARHRQRTSSPVLPHRTFTRSSAGPDRHERQSSEESDRRDQARPGAVKRRVLGPFDGFSNEFHKRGRFG